MKEKKFQIVEVTETQMHAGSKANSDVAKIAEKLGYKNVELIKYSEKNTVLDKLLRQVRYFKEWNKIYNQIPLNSIVLLQNPFHNKQLTRNKILKKLKEEKKVKFISVVHDVEELRQWLYNNYYKKEFDIMLKLSDVFIVHNEVMKNFFISKGIDKHRLICLEVFDYLQNESVKVSEFEKSITIAGNLDSQKSAYISKLGEIGRVKFNLYGINFDRALSNFSNINYHGAFPADVIPQKLSKGFGLIWDGDSIDSCTGNTGNYLKYNNPHKLSLYLSSGMPVVIWSEAAEANFVLENNVGFIVDSLFDLEEKMKNLTEAEYDMYSANVKKISQRMVSGYYTKRALKSAEKY